MASAADSKSINDLPSTVSVKLDRDNYPLWKSLVIAIVKGCRLDGHILGTKECPEEFIASADSSKKPNPAFENWQAHDSQLIGWLMNSMTIEMATQLLHCETSKQLWDEAQSLAGDELLSDSFPYKEIENGILWEVEGKWVVQGALDVDIGANPSAEGGDEDEGVDDQTVKVVDIVDTFRLQEQPPFDKKQFVTFVKRYIKLLTPKLEAEKQELFKKHIEGATKFLLSKLSDLQFFVGESMHDDGSLVFAYYKEGATDPTFIYFAHGLKEIKC